MDHYKLQTDFIEIIEKYKKMIYKVSHIYCNDADDIKDLFQDIISNLWMAYANFQQKSKISTWIYRISLNTAINWFRNYTKQSKWVQVSFIISLLSLALCAQTKNSIGMDMQNIPAGSFYMGSNGIGENFDEKPIHKVQISQPFAMSTTEVTNEQYELFDSSHKELRNCHDIICSKYE